MQQVIPRLRRGQRVSISLVIVGVLLVVVGRVLAGPDQQGATPVSPMQAVIAVERAPIFAVPDRTAPELTTVFERERVPVLAQHTGSTFLLTQVGGQYGWLLAAQVDLDGDLALVPMIASLDELPAFVGTPTLTFTPYKPLATAAPDATPTSTAFTIPTAGSTPVAFPTRTPLPTGTALPTGTKEPASTPDGDEPELVLTVPPSEEDDVEFVPFPGVPPPLTLDIPADWEQLHWTVPMRTVLDDSVREIPLSIYFGPLDPDVYGLIYVYWGFPNTLDFLTQEPNLWADGVQLLRGSLIGRTCNLGVYDQRTFVVGEYEGVGANYQSSECLEEANTAGWFAVVRTEESTFAFYMVVDPWDALPDYRANLQAILDTVEFTPLDAESE